jgi:hypothetical protein
MNAIASQNLLVFQDGPRFKALTDLTGETVHETESASQILQYAVDALSGGRIALGRGTFSLDQPVTLADNIWLSGGGRATRLLVGDGNKTGVGLQCLGHKGVVISDLALTAGHNPDARVGIVVDNCGDCTVRDVFCVGFAEYGIWVRNNAFLNEIRGCSLAGNGKANLELPADLPLYNGIELQNAQGYNVTGNTVFNWGVAPRIGVGIREDDKSLRNTITGNNINYYEHGDVVAEGSESIVGHNISYRDKPYQSGDTAGTVVQSFQTELTERFIHEQL